MEKKNLGCILRALSGAVHFSALTGMQLSLPGLVDFPFPQSLLVLTAAFMEQACAKAVLCYQFNTSSIALDWDEDAL